MAGKASYSKLPAKTQRQALAILRKPSAPHFRLYLFTLDSIPLPGKGKWIVIDDEAILGMTQDGGKTLSLAQGTMAVG